MSIYMPNWGSVPGRCCAKWFLAVVLVVSCEHSCFNIFLSCHGRKAFELLKGKPTLAKWDVVSGVKCFKKKSVLFSEVHPIMNFREAPHQIGPSLFSRAIACSPKRNRSWQCFVNTWQKPETTRRAFSEHKNGLAAVAMLAGKGPQGLPPWEFGAQRLEIFPYQYLSRETVPLREFFHALRNLLVFHNKQKSSAEICHGEMLLHSVRLQCQFGLDQNCYLPMFLEYDREQDFLCYLPSSKPSNSASEDQKILDEIHEKTNGETHLGLVS